MKRYYLLQNGRELGPFDARQIAELTRAGKIDETLLLREESQETSRSLREILALIFWYAVPIAVTIAIGIFTIGWYRKSTAANDILKANQAVASINEQLEDWLDSKTNLSPEKVKELVDLSKSYPKATNLELLVETVAKAKRKQLTILAEELFRNAKSLLAAGDLPSAHSMLSKYLDNQYAMNHSSAQRLLSEISFARNETELNTILSMLTDKQLAPLDEQVVAVHYNNKVSDPAIKSFLFLELKRLSESELKRREDEKQLQVQLAAPKKTEEELRNEEIRLAEIKAKENILSARRNPLDMTDKFDAVVNFSDKGIGSNSPALDPTLPDPELLKQKHLWQSTAGTQIEAFFENSSYDNANSMRIIELKKSDGQVIRLQKGQLDDVSQKLSEHLNRLKTEQDRLEKLMSSRNTSQEEYVLGQLSVFLGYRNGVMDIDLPAKRPAPEELYIVLTKLHKETPFIFSKHCDLAEAIAMGTISKRHGYSDTLSVKKCQLIAIKMIGLSNNKAYYWSLSQLALSPDTDIANTAKLSLKLLGPVTLEETLWSKYRDCFVQYSKRLIYVGNISQHRPDPRQTYSLLFRKVIDKPSKDVALLQSMVWEGQGTDDLRMFGRTMIDAISQSKIQTTLNFYPERFCWLAGIDALNYDVDPSHFIGASANTKDYILAATQAGLDSAVQVGTRQLPNGNADAPVFILSRNFYISFAKFRELKRENVSGILPSELSHYIDRIRPATP